MATARAYRLTGKPFKGTGQAKLVYGILAQAGKPLTVAEVSPILEAHPKFTTVQTAERIAAYYVCVFKKAGIVVPVELEPEQDTVWSDLAKEMSN